MNDEAVSGRWGGKAILALAARAVLAGVFLYMGWTKATHPVEFLKLLRQFDLFHDPFWLNLVAATLPWFELFCGVLLAAGVAVRGTGVLLVLMLVPFTVVVLMRALALQKAGGLPFCAIKFDCGCGAGEVLICRKLVENFLLLVLAVGLVLWRNHRLGLRPNVLARNQ